VKREVLFHTEAELCAAFLQWLTRYPEWTAYAETEGWDILLAHHDGTQIGIQAKLKFNMKVLEQSVESGLGWEATGPDYRAVLVPDGQGSVEICNALGLTLIRPHRHWNKGYEFNPGLDYRSWERWHFSNPEKRHELPRFVPDVAAGSSAPCQLTKWKIGALEICAVLEIAGIVTRQDFKRAGVDHRRWVESWLEPVPNAPGKWRWKNGTKQGFETAHPVIYPKVLAEVRSRTILSEVAA